MRPRTTSHLVAVSVLAFGFGTSAVTTSAAASRAPIKDCGDLSSLDRGGFFLGAVTAQGSSCRLARSIARKVTASASCRRNGSCSIEAYVCLLARAGKELTLVHCDGAGQRAAVRFEFGS